MTTLPQPQRRGIFRPSIAVIVAIVLVLAVIATVIVRTIGVNSSSLPAGTSSVTITRETLIAGISATGTIEPRLTAELAFPGQGGRVSEVLVDEGTAVEQGTALVQLEIRQLQAELAAAEAQLAQARADLQSLIAGATPEEVARAQAQLAQANGALQQTEGSVTSSDLTAAEQSVVAARARLAELEAGADPEQLARARAALDQTRAGLEQQRSALSSAKTQAERTLELRANAVRDAQAAWSTAQTDLQFVRDNGTDPRTLRSLTDAQKQDFELAFERARLRLADAETALAQAQVALDAARQNEIAGLAEAEARVNAAQADLDALLAGTDADELANARAQLSRAEADLARLQGLQREGALAAQRAAVDVATAQLNQLLADPTASELARAEARVAQEEAELALVQVRLEDATLRAPFAGLVAEVNVAPGEIVSGQAPITLIDVERYVVKVTVDEVDVSRVSIGQQVDVLLDALGAPALPGTVRGISPLSLPNQAVTAYEVTVEVDPDGRAVRAGMTASATIVTTRLENVLSVPAEAVRQENGASVVDLLVTDADGKPETRVQPVEVGATIDGRTEIRSGVNEGETVVIGAVR